MKKRTVLAVVVVVWVGLVGSRVVQATPIVNLVASSSVVAVGGSVTVSLVVSGLGVNAAPSIGAWQLDPLSFDPLRLTAQSVLYGDPVLGNQLDPSNSNPSLDLTPILNNTGGTVTKLGQTSTASVSDLNANQAASFTLARVVFQGGAAPGAAVISLCTPGTFLCLLGDAGGSALTFQAGPPLTLSVVVPQPSLASLLVLAVVALALRERCGRV